MKARLVRVTEDKLGSRMAEFDLADGTRVGLVLEQGDILTNIVQAIERYRESLQKVDVTPPELRDREFDWPEERDREFDWPEEEE